MSAWGWFLQRLSGGLLVLFLGAHLWLLHYVYLGERISFQRVMERLSSPLFFAIDLGVLAIALYHGLYGLRGIALEYRWGSPTLITLLALLVGLAGLAGGGYALWGFLS